MKIIVTGHAGFIGFHLSKLLLEKGHDVLGIDAMTPYYDVSIKEARRDILKKFTTFSYQEFYLEDHEKLEYHANIFKPEMIIHLAAQAGVRYSIENPRSYINSNIIGSFNVMEVARQNRIKHLLLASTSSVYGANEDFPFKETDKADTPLTIYAASKKATESLTHSYAHLWQIPTTCFRFFTVYGPYGRPDMALFKFVKNTLEDKPIDVYNHGEMARDFTYIDDLVTAIDLLKDAVPPNGLNHNTAIDSKSHVAPFRVVNIGGGTQVKLLDFIDAIEDVLQKKIIKNYMEMQTGDVMSTIADYRLLKDLTGFIPSTDYRQGIKKFIEWYKTYYEIGKKE